MNPEWFKNNVAYTIAKYGMSMCTLGMAEEFKQYGIAVNSLWPKAAIETAAIRMLAGDDTSKFTRIPEIMADAAYIVLSKNPKDEHNTGNFHIDDDVLYSVGISDLSQYRSDPSSSTELRMDIFLDMKPKDKNVFKHRSQFTSL